MGKVLNNIFYTTQHAKYSFYDSRFLSLRVNFISYSFVTKEKLHYYAFLFDYID